MNTAESSQLLLSVVNNAEDITLILDNYLLCQADDVLRKSIDFDGRPLVLLGTEKRHNMCKKKLPTIFKKIGIPYDESKITFITNEQLKEFVDTALLKLKNGEKPAQTFTESISVNPEEDIATTLNPITDEYSIITKDEEVPPLHKESTDSNVYVHKEVAQVSSVCRYGVPIIRVEYIPPNVLGLQESITVKVDEEDISKFFNSVKNRVLDSINNDR